MIRKFKALGLALVAVLAMSVVVASAAQAKPVFTTSVSPVSVHGTGTEAGEKFTVDGVTTECEVSHYTGTVTNNTSTARLNPTYTNCKLAGTGITVHVKMNKCGYEFTLTQKDLPDTYTAHVKIVCDDANPIQIEGTGTSCEATVSPAGNEALTTVDITNDATDITIRPTVAGITANVTKDGFLCPFSGTGHKTGGTYTSAAGEKGAITGTAASGTIQISGE